MKYLHIRNAHLIDPVQDLDDVSDLYVSDGRIAAIGHNPPEGTIDRTIDVQEKWLVPGFIDLSTYLNEPGYAQKGSIARDTKAAAQAGFTHICSQPQTKPVADSSAVIQQILERSSHAKAARVLPLGALTKGLEGETLSNMVSLRNAGCIALSNARAPIKDSYVVRRLMEYASTYDIRLFITPLDTSLAADGVMHEGSTSTRLGLAGIPETAETIALAQILLLAEQTGARVHVSQISSARSVDMLADAKAKGLNISADVSIANLCFTDQQINGYNSRFHVDPPLRSEADRQALLAAVNRRELIICSNHRPHEIAAKKAPFAASAPGMSLYHCFLPLLLKLIDAKELDRNAAIQALSHLPAQTLGLEREFREGAVFNAAIIDQQAPATATEQEDLSSPVCEAMSGLATATFVDGQLVTTD